jgi:hypothetical protein
MVIRGKLFMAHGWVVRSVNSTQCQLNDVKRVKQGVYIPFHFLPHVSYISFTWVGMLSRGGLLHWKLMSCPWWPH